MRHKTFELVETKTDDETGSFTALASVFGNVDKGGDRMMPGSFAKTLEKWRETGRPIPIILSHQWDNLKAWVGKADPRAVYEDDTGLVVQGQLDMEDADARKVHKLMKEGLLTGWSFGYSVPKGGEKSAKDGANEISEVELFEIGPTLIGMNPEAQLQAVKSAEPEVKEAVKDLAYKTSLVDNLKSLLEDLESGALSEDEVQERLKTVQPPPTPEVEDAADEEPKGQVPAQDPLADEIDRWHLEALAGKSIP